MLDGDDSVDDDGAEEVRTAPWDGSAAQTIQFELNGSSSDGDNYTLGLGAMTIAGERFETGDPETCSVQPVVTGVPAGHCHDGTIISADVRRRAATWQR